MASHIPGQDNLIADFLSRGRVLPSEWTLHPTVMDQMAREISPLEVDLFTSALNARLPRYCSRVQDPAAWRIDAFSFPWKGFRGYAFPPISLIPRVLRKIREDQAWVVLIAPRWPRRNWFLDLIGLLAGSPRTLPLRSRHQKCQYVVGALQWCFGGRNTQSGLLAVAQLVYFLLPPGHSCRGALLFQGGSCCRGTVPVVRYR